MRCRSIHRVICPARIETGCWKLLPREPRLFLRQATRETRTDMRCWEPGATRKPHASSKPMHASRRASPIRTTVSARRT